MSLKNSGKVNKDMILKAIYALTILAFICSCRPRTETSNDQPDIHPPTAPDPNQTQYIKNIIGIGKKVFKEKCIACHCPPGAHVEPPYTCKLQYAFDKLPLDSLSHFEAFIKNRSKTKPGLRKNRFLTGGPNEENYVHNFGEKLSDSLVKAVIEYLWIGYRHTD